MPTLHLARGRFLFAQENLQESGFATAVGPHDTHPLSTRQVEAKVLEEDFVVETLGEVLGVKDDIAGTSHFAEGDVRSAHFRGLLESLNLFEGLGSRLRLFGELTVMHAANVLFLLLDVLALRFVFLEFAFVLLVAQPHILFEAAWKRS